MLDKSFLSYLPILFSAVVVVWLTTQKQKPWHESTEKEKRAKIKLIIVLILLFVAGIVVFFRFPK